MENLEKILIDLLKDDPEYVKENKINKEVVFTKVYSYDELFLRKILQEPALKANFFKDLDGISIFKINEFYAGEKKEIIKYLYQPLDIFNYSEMKLFVHGDLYRSTDPSSLTYNKNAYVYLRFGTDTLNYYE